MKKILPTPTSGRPLSSETVQRIFSQRFSRPVVATIDADQAWLLQQAAFILGESGSEEQACQIREQIQRRVAFTLGPLYPETAGDFSRRLDRFATHSTEKGWSVGEDVRVGFRRLAYIINPDSTQYVRWNVSGRVRALVDCWMAVKKYKLKVAQHPEDRGAKAPFFEHAERQVVALAATWIDGLLGPLIDLQGGDDRATISAYCERLATEANIGLGDKAHEVVDALNKLAQDPTNESLVTMCWQAIIEYKTATASKASEGRKQLYFEDLYRKLDAYSVERFGKSLVQTDAVVVPLTAVPAESEVKQWLTGDRGKEDIQRAVSEALGPLTFIQVGEVVAALKAKTRIWQLSARLDPAVQKLHAAFVALRSVPMTNYWDLRSVIDGVSKTLQEFLRTASEDDPLRFFVQHVRQELPRLLVSFPPLGEGAFFGAVQENMPRLSQDPQAAERAGHILDTIKERARSESLQAGALLGGDTQAYMQNLAKQCATMAKMDFVATCGSVYAMVTTMVGGQSDASWAEYRIGPATMVRLINRFVALGQVARGLFEHLLQTGESDGLADLRDLTKSSSVVSRFNKEMGGIFCVFLTLDMVGQGSERLSQMVRVIDHMIYQLALAQEEAKQGMETGEMQEALLGLIGRDQATWQTANGAARAKMVKQMIEILDPALYLAHISARLLFDVSRAVTEDERSDIVAGAVASMKVPRFVQNVIASAIYSIR